jgi:hypothetical protein
MTLIVKITVTHVVSGVHGCQDGCVNTSSGSCWTGPGKFIQGHRERAGVEDCRGVARIGSGIYIDDFAGLFSLSLASVEARSLC